MHIMLTRCQAAMIIVTQRGFLRSPRAVKKILLAKLAGHWEQCWGARGAWADAMEAADKRALRLRGIQSRALRSRARLHG